MKGLDAIMSKLEGHEFLLALREAEKIRNRHDYVSFMEYVLGIDCLYTREPEVRSYLTEVGSEIVYWLQTRWDTVKVNGEDQLRQKSPRKLLVVVPRKTFKTSGVSQVAPVFAAINDPNIVCGIMSSSYEKLAVPIADAIRAHFSGKSAGSRIRELYGSFEGPKWSGTSFTISQRTAALRDHTVSAYGVRQGAVGHHFDLFILDDPVTNEAMMNDSDWLNRSWKSWIDLQATLNPNSLVIVVMTRYHDDDLVGRIARGEIRRAAMKSNKGREPEDWDPDNPACLMKYGPLAGWKVIYKQAIENLDEDGERYLFPNIWPPERIETVRRGRVEGQYAEDEDADEYSELFFWCQRMNQPFKRKDNPIKEVHIEAALGTPERWSIAQAPRTGWVDIHCDFAFKNAEAYMKQSGDFTVAHVVSKLDGYVWRINGYRGKPTQDQFADELLKLAYWARNEWNARVRFLSYDRLTGQGSGDRSTEMWLQNLFRAHPSLNMPTVMEITRSKKKEASILGTAWAWQEGWVRLCKEAPYNDPLVYQMSRIGYTAHDDDADAFACSFHKDMYKVAKMVESEESKAWDWEPAVLAYDEEDESWLLPTKN